MPNYSGTENIIEFRNISQTYTKKNDKGKDETFVVFEDFTFGIEDHPDKGQFVVLMGPSGCGKSTLFRYLTGLQKPTKGEVFLKGKPLAKTDTIPMVFQNPSSLEWLSVIDNVALPLTLKGVPKKQAHEKAMEMIKVVGLEDHANKWAKYPILSGGQLQRVAIARSLVANPEMVLLDEPFSALDTKRRKEMQLFLAEMFYNSEVADLNPTFILITHDAREAAYLANDLYIMGANPGSIREHKSIAIPHRTEVRRTPEFLDLVTEIETIV